jgi:hypothetical protein
MLIMDDSGAKKREPAVHRKSRPCRNADGAVMVALVPLVFSKALERFIWETINGLFEPLSFQIR